MHTVELLENKVYIKVNFSLQLALSMAVYEKELLYIPTEYTAMYTFQDKHRSDL